MRKHPTIHWAVWLFAAVALADGAMFAYLRFVDTPGWPSDSIAHILNARMMLEGMTPGFSQLGFWPPMLHLLLLPAVSIDAVYKSDVAGFVTLFPVLYAAAYCLFRIVEILTDNRKYAWFATALFLLNPYALYFSSAAMTEMVFVSAFLAFFFFWLRWMKGADDTWLLCSACMVSVCFLSRYEGIVMIPIVIPLFFACALYRGASLRQSIALTLLSAILVLLGIAWVFLYGLYYGGDPLAFLSIGVRSSSEASVQSSAVLNQIQRLTVSPEQVVFSWRVAMAAAKHMMGAPVWLVGGVLYAFAIVTSRNLTRATALILASIPFLSIFALLSLRRAGIAVPDVLVEAGGRGQSFHNTRYLLPAIVLPVIGSAVAVASLRAGRMTRIARAGIVSVLLLLACWNMYDVLRIKNFQVIRRDITRIESVWKIASSKTLLDQFYDYGFVLSVRYFAEVAIVRSYVPLEAYVHEGTYKFIRQAMGEPWLFARLVVVNNNAGGPEINRLRAVSQSEAFRWYYDEVYRDGSNVVYKLNDVALRSAAFSLGYSPMSIPSLRQSFTPWDPDEIYEQLKAPVRESAAR